MTTFHPLTTPVSHRYTQSSVFDWDPLSKKEELFNEDSRFIVILDGSTLIAYTMFRFDREESWDVVYCYELQVAEAAQSRGIGNYLVTELCRIAHSSKMSRVMLTVLTANERATNFYLAQGFLPETSEEESENADDEDESDESDDNMCMDYQILHKPCLTPPPLLPTP